MRTTTMPRRFRRAIQRAALAVIIATSGAAHAADPQLIAKSGGNGIAACASCHGAAGQGQGNFPRLAGLNAGYLERQLDDLAAGRRASPVMQPIARALAPADRLALARYYGALPATTAGGASTANPVGERIALRGAWSKGVPACVQCHGPSGVGVGTTFPALTGQQAGYITAQLQAFRAGQRKNDPLQLMRAPASKLTDDEIDAVSRWFASQSSRTAGAKP